MKRYLVYAGFKRVTILKEKNKHIDNNIILMFD